MEISVSAHDHTYIDPITRYFSKEIPTVIPPKTNNLLEILTEILIGTKDTRYGTIPVPEHLVVVREVIRGAISYGIPIPILVPFGGIKANKTGFIDIAEFSAINRLVRLNELVQRYYGPGIHANVRIEDTNALFLYGTEYEGQVESYSANLAKMIGVLSPMGHINPVREKDILDKAVYLKYAAEFKPLLSLYLNETEADPTLIGKGKEFEALQERGWKGEIVKEQRDFYVERYSKLYPGQPREVYMDMIATYLAGSKARHDLKGTAEPYYSPINGKFIQINYTQPVPGAPSTMFNNALYHRTLPFNEARTHMPAWRAKGYLKVDAHGSIKSKITSFNDTETTSQLLPAYAKIGNGQRSIVIQADYICE